jgi:hypothetical protein
MSANAADGAALVAAAVQAAIRERAPRRTVAAVAAAVAGTVLGTARPNPPAAVPQARTQDAPRAADETDDPAQLLESLRAVRRAQRNRKKQRRREAKQAAVNSQRPATLDDQYGTDVSPTTGAAGQRAEHVGALADAPALAPQCPPAAADASASCVQPSGPASQTWRPGRLDRDLLEDLGIPYPSDLDSETASAGMQSRSHSATGARPAPYTTGTPSVLGRQ